MKALLGVTLLAVSLCGCDGDCSVSQATGLLAPFSQGCNAGSVIDGDNINFSILIGLGDSDANLYKSLDFDIVGPFYLGRRQTAAVSVSPLGHYSSETFAHGVVDLIIDGADYSKSFDRHFNINIVNLEVHDDSTQQAGVLKGSISVIATTATP